MVIGQAVGKPLWSFLISLVVHFIFDMIPHGDSRLYASYKNGEMKKRAVTTVTVDSILTILWVIFSLDTVSSEIRRSIVYGIAGSVLPDLLVGLGETFRENKWLKKFDALHLYLHSLIVKKINRDWPWLIGITFQMAVFTVLACVIIR